MTAGQELWALVRVLLSLAVVLSLAVLSLRYVLPWLQSKGVARRRETRVEVLEIAPLDRQHKLAVVRWAGREILIGFGGGGFRRLASQPAGAAAPHTDAAPEEPRAPRRAGAA